MELQAAGGAPVSPRVSRARAGIVLATLTFVYVLNFLDRQLLGILAKPIQDSLHITDGDLGQIGGLYFAVFYCFIAIPVGWFADRTNRVNVLSLACAIWSAATIACGLASTYPQLVAARMAVGFGEAGGVPPSYAIITDTFPPGKRGTALGIYNLGPPIGAALGVAFGASIAAAFDWRDAFVAIGAIGIVTAVIVRLIVREPERGALDAIAGAPPAEKAPFWGTIGMFVTNPVLMLAALGSGATQFVTYGLGNFAVLFLIREKGMTLNEIAIWYALVVGLGMGASMLISGRVIDRMTRKTRAAYATAPALSLALALPFYVAFVWAPSWQLALVLLTVVNVLNYFYLSSSVALVQEEVRPNQRVLSGALLLLVMNFIGLGLGPTWVGAASDFFAAQHVPHTLQIALYTLTPFYLIAIFLFLRLARVLRARPFRESRMTLFRCLTALAALALSLPAAAQTAPVVKAPAGAVKGTDEGNIRVFKGIPYALPPVQGRRWQPPVAMPRWNGVREATAFGPACVQPVSKVPNVYSAAEPLPMSEDCLTLNIWAPANAKNAPVFFWIHGGALVSGSSREALYDGRRMAERGVIVVSVNYRLGVLGWMAHPQLSAETAQKVSGNYGLFDQMTALFWVHNNIAAFGGDAKNVTIAGESAGALSALYLMSSPLARGLFHKVIAESGYMLGMPELKKAALGMPSGEAVGQMLQGGLQASDIKAMRAIGGEELTTRAAGLGFQPWGLVDGFALPQQMVTAFDQGKQAPVPVLIGFNQGEIRSLMVLAPKPPASAADYEAVIRDRYGELADAFLKLYPAADYQESILLTVRDGLYGWTSERVARKQAAVGQPTYVYLFDHGYPAMDARGLHAFHASELPYVFGTMASTGPQWPKIPETPAEQGLSDAMLGYWTSFAATGTPSAASAPAWPAFGAERAFMHFADVPRPSAGLMPGMYELNEAVMCRRRAANAIAWPWNIGVASAKLPPKAQGCD